METNYKHLKPAAKMPKKNNNNKKKNDDVPNVYVRLQMQQLPATSL